MYVQPKNVNQHSTNSAWAYIGSANCSLAAWGNVNYLKSGKVTQKGNNWECGIIIPIKRTPEEEFLEHKTKPATLSRQTNDKTHSLEIFKGVIPIPMEIDVEQLTEENKPFMPMN
jgi:hypothetical protein